MADRLQRQLQAAEAAWAARNSATAVEAFEVATRLAPADAGLRVRLGRIHALRHDYAAAEACFEEALRLAPQQTEMLVTLANLCRDFRSPNLAESYLRRTLNALTPTPVWPPTALELAKVYERMRRLPEATELVDRVLASAPEFPGARLMRARLERTAGRLEVAETVLRSFLHKPIPLLWTHAQAWYELATVLDRQKRYDEAMAAVQEAKNLLMGEAAKQFGTVRLDFAFDEIERVLAKVTKETFQRWHNLAGSLDPNRRLALLSGYPRSGTTLLEQVLDAHPDIVSAEETDIFFDEVLPAVKCYPPTALINLDNLERADLSALKLARSRYFGSMERCIGKPVGERLLIDKNPTLRAHIPSFLRVFPEAKILFALRDPRDSVLSRFMLAEPLAWHTTPFLTWEGTVADYVNTMKAWQRIKPLLPLPPLEVRYEDMVGDLESVARKTLDFLGVPWDERVLGFDQHARERVVRSPTYADVTQPVYKRAVGRWQHYQKYLEPHLEKLEPFVKAFGY